MKIGRTLFWFKEGDTDLLSENERYFGLATLLNRLLNEKYIGKNIKFINLDFSSDTTYQLHPHLPKDAAYYYGGHLKYFGVIDFPAFNRLEESKKCEFIWEKGCEYLIKSGNSIKNMALKEAAEYALKKGMEINLNPDYRLVEANVIVHGQQLKAAVWVNFKNDGMYSKLTLEKGEEIVYEKDLDETKNGVEFFLEMYTGITVKDNVIIINGDKDVDVFPIKIAIEKVMI